MSSSTVIVAGTAYGGT